MSESPKMGLFGSKDTTKETKKETKDDSPDRYAPYCIDSDSETYDTEALSIMDINDIIGVQSEPVSDSTLESEIAALSQIITESKTDGGQNTAEAKCEMQQKDVPKNKEISRVEDVDAARVSDTATEESRNVCCVKKVIHVSDIEQLNKENLQLSNENNVQESEPLNNERKHSDKKDNLETNTITDCTSINAKDIENVDIMNKIDVEFVRSIDNCTSAILEVVKNEENVNISNVNESADKSVEIIPINRKIMTVEGGNNICGSLQLIGEAYSSEDSQETNMNDTELKVTDTVVNSHKNCLIPSDEQKETNESCELYVVNNTTDMSDSINTDKISINKNITIVLVENEAHGTEVNAPNCSMKYKCIREFSDTLEDKEGIVPNQCKVDNSKIVVSECKKEEVDEDTADTNSMKEALEEKKVDKMEVIQENVTMEQFNIEVDKENIESVDDTCVSLGKKQETKFAEDNIETKEHQDNEECVHKKEINQENNKHISISDTENNTGNDMDIIQKKDELETDPMKCHLENVDDSSACESQKSDSLHTTDSSEILGNKTDMLELLQGEQETDIEKLKTTEIMQQDSLESVNSQLSPKTSNQIFNVIAEEDSVSSSNINVESAEVNRDMQIEDNKNLKEPVAYDSVDAIEHNRSEDEAKTKDSETISKYETSNEVKLNVDSVTYITQSQIISDTTTYTDSSIIENSSVSKINSLEENNDGVKHEIGIIKTESLKVEECISEKQNEKSNEFKDMIVEEIKIEKISDVANISDESIESKESKVCEKYENVNLNFPEENKIKDDKNSFSKISLEHECAIEKKANELKEYESSCKIDEEERSKQPLENDITIVQNEIDKRVSESKDCVKTEKQISNPIFIKKNQFSLALDHTEVLGSEKIREEEDTEEEMSLTLEPEETDSTSEIGQSNLEQKSGEESVKEFVEKIDKGDQQNLVAKMDDVESLNIEKSVVSNINAENTIPLDNVENTALNKSEELPGKEQVEDNDLKSNIDKNNLKNILETANTVEEIFSGEQCQNTQDIVTSILDDVRSATDFKNILNAETGVANEIEKVLQQAADLPLVEAEIEELTEKLPQNTDVLNKGIEDSISTQNIDSLEGLLGLDLIPEEEDSALKMVKPEEQTQEQEILPKDVDMSLLLEQSNAPDMTQASDYITDVISSCLTNRNTIALEDDAEKISLTEAVDNKSEEIKTSNILEVNENVISKLKTKDDNVEDLQKQLEASTGLQENELDMDFEETPLESVSVLEESRSKLELASDTLLQNAVESENLNDAQTGVETSQPSSEISELESAVKFLQESEEQAIDSPLVLSPKMVESVVDNISKQADASSLFVPDEDICGDPSELVVELQDITTDSISISEAEIISEAAKLESEKKLAEQIKIDTSVEKFVSDEDKAIMEKEQIKISETQNKFDTDSLQNIEMQQVSAFKGGEISETMATLSQNVLKTSESIPKVSILEERLKEPPKIEIPTVDITKVSMSPTTSKDSLLIQKDAKLIAYQKMLESPKLSEKTEPKIMETPRKDSEKHDFENVGSPRIILKIAKSAITDCGEPRSPKSPKIRSATNSPNPEDSPGQKLGKIKLKLSKGGHPSIISNENVEEAGQWYSESSSSLSPIGMKIKLSKSGDVSIVSSEKHESGDDSKEVKHKFEEVKRTESPIGMKIKLSKTGDASIVQQDSKDIQMKHKDKLDIVQGSPKRTESPIGMKIKLSKSGDASIIQPERQDFPEEYKDNAQLRSKEKLEGSYNSPKRTDSPIGMKIKLFKSGDVSIVSPDMPEDGKETSKAKDKVDSPPEIPKRNESPMAMKIKLAKTKGGASIISMENLEDMKEKLEIPDVPKRTESPLGMKIKLSKSGDASIVHSEISEEDKDAKQKEKLGTKEKLEMTQEMTKSLDTSSSMKIKVIKSGETPTIAQESGEELEATQESLQKIESSIGMKIKLSKFGDASIVPSEKQEHSEEMKSLQEIPKRTESPLGMKIKLSKTGDASIIQTEPSEDVNKMTRTTDMEHLKITDTLGMKIKLLKTGDASIVESEKKERQQRRRDAESPLEMKIKLSKTGHPTIVACENHGESVYKSKEISDQSHGFPQRYKDPAQAIHKETTLKILKTGHSSILHSNRSELTIEPVQIQNKKAENVIEISPKRKEITIAPIEPKKSKLETQLTQILPEVTIQPVASRDQKQFLFDPKNSAISLQQMNVISQEISITQVRPTKPQDTTMSEKLKDILAKNTTGSPINSDCEIIEHRPELIIVNENSNSSQDVVIIEEVSSNRMPEVKVPKKRGRPRRNPLPQTTIHPPTHLLISRDPLSMEEAQQMQQPQAPHFETRENERPKRTCRSQKSYAPPKRGRGRGRGKRKLDSVELQMIKKPRVEQDLTAIEASTMAIITIDESSVQQESFGKSPELYKALKQPTMESKVSSTNKAEKKTVTQKNDGDPSSSQSETIKTTEVGLESSKMMPKPTLNDSRDNAKDKKSVEIVSEKLQKNASKLISDEKIAENTKSENKEMLVPPGHSNWLAPISKRPAEGAGKQDNLSTIQVIDEETRMSAESNSRSQTPARNISVPASEPIVNEESQGSVLSTATTESEKVKVKNRRMEINFDPDEGPFTVDKITEYKWPLDRKGETFMIQEQISQYLGVKSFKRKYPDLKRRVVDMEERNYLRENGLVSEAMCDMGLTAICSSEVLDVMCSDFPDQYEEYRKHMHEKQVKEHSKKQKELTAATNAEKNRIDLAEMAVQSALAWNINLNKARRENRKCSLDLQTFTIHVPKKQQKVEMERKIGHYPVALIPGQYTDYYREYTPAELRYYPLNTVLYGPMRPNERKFDSQSEGSQSDSDSDSSSDDSSSSSSEGTQDTEGSQSTMDEVDMEIVNQKDEIKLKCKMCLKTLNKHSKSEVLIQCGTCNGHVHPSCIDLTLDMVPHIQSYAWQCTDCKTCAQCHDPADEDKMLFCDMCDRGYHIYCVGLRRVPQGRWHCQECAVCANCGSREPGGMNSDRNSVAQWQHEYKKGDKNTRVYVSTLCIPCSKMRGEQGTGIRQEKLSV